MSQKSSPIQVVIKVGLDPYPIRWSVSKAVKMSVLKISFPEKRCQREGVRGVWVKIGGDCGTEFLGWQPF